MPDANTVLVVIHMQADYVAAQDVILRASIEAAAKAVALAGGHILAVSFDGNGAPTVQLPEGTRTIWKHEDDGGDLVYAWASGAGLISEATRFVFCGVNLGACVFKTAVGLAWRMHNEDGISDVVTVDDSLCGEGSRWKVRFGRLDAR